MILSLAFRGLSVVLRRSLVVACLCSAFLSALAQTNTGRTNLMSQLRAIENAVVGKEFVEQNRSALSFGLDQIEELQVTVLHRPLWQYLAFSVYLVLAFLVSHILDWIIRRRVKSWAKKTVAKWDDILVGLLDGPVKVIAFVLLLNLGLQIFDWPDWLKGWISKCTLLLVFLSASYVLLKAIDALFGVAKRRLQPGGDRAFNEQFLVVCGKAAKAVLIVIAILTLFANFGVDIAAVLGSLSVLGLAIGLAAQDTVANLFGAVSVFVDKPFQLGDRIQIGAIDGTVEEMGLRATQVRTADGYLVTVPNKSVGNNTVINITRRASIKTDLNFLLSASTPATQLVQAIKLLEEIFRNEPQTSDLIVFFDRISDTGLNIKVIHWWGNTDARANFAGIQKMNLAVKARFEAEGIALAGTDRSVYLLREAVK